MPVIPLTLYPLTGSTYHTPEAAIRGAMSHPLRHKAEADGAMFKRATVAEFFWTDAEHVVGFSNGRYLHLTATEGRVEWRVTDERPVLAGEAMTVGSPPVVLAWPRIGESEMDVSSSARKRLGAEARGLFADEAGIVSLYCRGHDVLGFAAVRRADLNRPMLYVSECE